MQLCNFSTSCQQSAFNRQLSVGCSSPDPVPRTSHLFLLCGYAVVQLCGYAIVQLCNCAILQFDNYAGCFKIFVILVRE